MNTSDEVYEESKDMTQEQNMVKLFMFKLTVEYYRTPEANQEQIISFTHSNNWNRATMILQIARLYTSADGFALDDGVNTHRWQNTEDDINRIIRELNGE